MKQYAESVKHNCLFMSFKEYERILKRIYPGIVLSYNDDGIMYGFPADNPVPDIIEDLSKYFDTEVVMVFKDRKNDVWICYNDPEEMVVEIEDFIDADHQDSVWYGGQCARVLYKGYVAEICANGDVYAQFAPGGEFKDEVKDKNNGGEFYGVMKQYFANDEEMFAAYDRGDLIFDYGNWWECFIVDKNGVRHDLMWNLDSSDLLGAIDEVKGSLDNFIENLVDDFNENNDSEKEEIF